MIYADCAAQRPPREEALLAAAQAMEHFGNPSGVHAAASRSAQLLFQTRKKTAAAIGAQPSEIIFTASGTEADNAAVFSSAVSGLKKGKDKLLIFSAEHSAVINAALAAQDILGCRVEFIPCLPDGTADIAALKCLVDDKTALVSLMTANNETGVIQPVCRAADTAHRGGALFHTDAVQAVGQLETDVNKIKCDMLSLSAHKFGGIAGAGALYCRSGTPFVPLINGGGQERGRRAGTQAVPALCAMGAAIEAACEKRQSAAEYIAGLRDRLQTLIEPMNGAVIMGKDSPRLPGTLCVCFEGRDGEELALRLDRMGVCVSSKAACSTGGGQISHVLTAMGVKPHLAQGAVRFSLCDENTPEEMELIAEKLKTLI